MFVSVGRDMDGMRHALIEINPLSIRSLCFHSITLISCHNVSS